jgi:hypothetical protein
MLLPREPWLWLLAPSSQTSHVTMSCKPDADGNYPLFATFTPNDGVSGSSVVPSSPPFVNSSVTADALRFPPTLYVGEPTLLGSVLVAGFPGGARSSTSTQSINVLPARALDSITTRASGLGILNGVSPEVLVAGGNTTLSSPSGSGSPVVFSESGLCVIADTTLATLSAGQCTVTATTAGHATL